MLDVSIRGLQKLQAQHVRMIAALKPGGGLGRAIKYATVEAHRYLTSIIHVDTGSYRAAQRMEIKGARGRLYTDPAVKNPKTGEKPAEYSVYEELRGGSHAAYSRTIKERGDQIASRAISYTVKEMGL
jgi:hypothetical protein